MYALWPPLLLGGTHTKKNRNSSSSNKVLTASAEIWVVQKLVHGGSMFQLSRYSKCQDLPRKEYTIALESPEEGETATGMEAWKEATFLGKIHDTS